MQREHLYVRDIVRACDAIARYVAEVERDAFLADDLLQSGVAFQFSIIGEAVRNAPDDLKQRYPDVAWVNARSTQPDCTSLLLDQLADHLGYGDRFDSDSASADRYHSGNRIRRYEPDAVVVARQHDSGTPRWKPTSTTSHRPYEIA